MIPWVLEEKFSSYKDYECFKAKRPYVSTKSQKLNCTICHSKNHKMRVQYGICRNIE